MAELEGRVLGRYKLQRLLGKGGMANVYEALDTQVGRFVAVKIFKREDDTLLLRFQREAQVMGALMGHHLVPIYDAGTWMLDAALMYYIVMPYMVGGTLRGRIRGGALSLDETSKALRDIAEALDYIHSRGIIHRDIKASNVLISDDGGCYLADFGIARITDDEAHLTTTGNVLGTVDYIAPELFESDRKADRRSDLYALGVLLFEMVTGRLPFSAESQIALVNMHMRQRPPLPSSIIPSIPRQVENVMLKALEKKPELRYGNASELAEALRVALTQSAQDNPQFPASNSFEQASRLILPPLSPARTARPTLNLQPHTPFLGNAPSPYADETIRSNQPLQVPGLHSPMTPPPAPFFRRRWFSYLLAFMAVILLAGSLTFVFASFYRPGANQGTATHTPSHKATPNLSATSALLTATAIARVNATNTAIAGPTATAAAQASATAGVIQTATSGQPLYKDPLNNQFNPTTENAGWDTGSQCAFQSDGYHVSTSSSLKGCREANNTYQDATISVNMKVISGDAGGVFFRVNSGAFGLYYGYLFEISSTSQYQYRILSSDHYSVGSPNILQNWTALGVTPNSDGSYLLQIIMSGSYFSFWANGTYLTTLSDTSYTSGQVAFLAWGDLTSTGTEMAYSHLAVYPA